MWVISTGLRDVEIDFMSSAYKNLTEQIFEKPFFKAALGNVLSLFAHNAHSIGAAVLVWATTSLK